ncbi:thiol-disulfide oxidoreductase DCC family protein [Flavobacterium sp.]|jgi:predicted DCC family thiol-disulfide oxidoreductase YuxK|uniref:thiol-disulfide oxidoreductase DCC family protein n=1 Tax=Flavobacterium sp. TaxID=239 RepID=UPI0037C0FEAA
MEISDLPKDKKIILFDGVCNLCNASVQYVIKHDEKDVFRFVSLQSELGQKIQKHIGIADKNIDSVVLYLPGIAYYYKSTAVIEITKSLQGIFNYGLLFKILPTPLRDIVYDYIAKNRFKWFGKNDSCMIPTPELKAKFLE